MHSAGWKLGAVVLLAAAALFTVLVFPVQDYIKNYHEWTEEHEVVGSLTFSLVYAACTVLLVPASALSLGAGAIFGLLVGVAVVWAGAVAGLLLAFLVGRYLLRDWVETSTRKYPTWQGIEGAVSQEGWKIVLLLRLAPAIPFGLLNYALALTSVPFGHYLLASAVGIFPGTVMFVYVGSLAKSVDDIIKGRTQISLALSICIAIITGIAIIGSGCLLTFYAKQALKRHVDRESSLEEDFDANDVDILEGGSERQPLTGGRRM